MGKTWLTELGDYEGSQKALVCQFLDGKHDSIIVLDSE